MENITEAITRSRDALFDTVTLAAIATPMAGIIAMIAALLIVRKKFHGKRLLEILLMTPFALPGTLVGISYILAFNHAPIILVGTAAIIIINYVMRELPVGIEGGLMALMICMQFDFSGWFLIFSSILLSIVLCTILGWLYGKLMNAVKGAEMTIATYSGFSIVAFFNIFWLAIPFSNRKMGWMLGNGLRETIQFKNFDASRIVSDFLKFEVAGVTIPVGMMLVFALICLLVWLFFRSKTGMAIYAGGQNPRFAEASGLDIDSHPYSCEESDRFAVGIIIYSQGYGYAQLYNGPLNMAFPAVAAVLVGGATASKASIPNVLIGVCLFQGLMTTAMPVMNLLFTGTDLSDIMRIIIQNGVILYALTKVKSGGDR